MDYGDEAMLREVYGEEFDDDQAQLAQLRDPAWESPEVEEQLKVGRIVEEYDLGSEAAAEKLSKSLRGWLQGNEKMCDAASRLVKGVELEIGIHGTSVVDLDIGMRGGPLRSPSVALVDLPDLRSFSKARRDIFSPAPDSPLSRSRTTARSSG